VSAQEEVVVVASSRGVGAYRWALALVAVTAVWGSTSVLVRDAVVQLPQAGCRPQRAVP
jgi:hypothetical protein